MFHVLCFLFFAVAAASKVPCERPDCGELIYGVWIDGSNVTYVYVNNNPFPYTMQDMFYVGDFSPKKVGVAGVVLSQEMVVLTVENSASATDLALYDGFKMKVHQFASAIPSGLDDITFLQPLPFNNNLQLVVGTGRMVYQIDVPSDFSAVKLTKVAELPASQCDSITAGTVAPTLNKLGGNVFVTCGSSMVYRIVLAPTIKVQTIPVQVPTGAKMAIESFGYDTQLQKLWWFGNYSDPSLHNMLSLGEMNFAKNFTSAVIVRDEPITVGSKYLKGNMAMDELNRLAHIMVEFNNFDQVPTPLMYSLQIQEGGRVYDFGPVTYPACKSGKCRLTATVTP